jgi:hypothetical protein
MSVRTVTGSRQRVVYRISGNLGIFQYCNSSRCRKFTGSALDANLLVWVQGEEHVDRYAKEGAKHFATAFCTHCVSSL